MITIEFSIALENQRFNINIWLGQIDSSSVKGITTDLETSNSSFTVFYSLILCYTNRHTQSLTLPTCREFGRVRC
jgi:hypothetical protein